MKLISVIFALLVLNTIAVHAQNNASCDTSGVVTSPDVLPEFPGCDEALMNYLVQNVSIPKNSDCDFFGTVLIEFIVDKNGQIVCPRIVRPEPGACVLKNGFGEHLVQVILNMPDWIPAMQNGENVSARYVIPLQFMGPH